MDNDQNNNDLCWHHHYPTDSKKTPASKYFEKIELLNRELLNRESNLRVMIITSKNSEINKDAHYFIFDMNEAVNNNNEFIKFRRKYKDITENRLYTQIMGNTKKRSLGERNRMKEKSHLVRVYFIDS